MLGQGGRHQLGAVVPVALVPAVELEPGGDGGASAAAAVGALVGGFPRLDEVDGPAPAALEFVSGSDGSQTWRTSGTVRLFS